jgi:hypothetical protein
MTGQAPEDENKRRFRLVEGGALPDTVVAAQRWCAAHPGTRIEFADGWYSCLREGEVIAASITLAALLAKLERLFPDEGGGPVHEPRRCIRWMAVKSGLAVRTQAHQAMRPGRGHLPSQIPHSREAPGASPVSRIAFPRSCFSARPPCMAAGIDHERACGHIWCPLPVRAALSWRPSPLIGHEKGTGARRHQGRPSGVI